MPSQRRIRLLFCVVLAGVITTLLFTSHFRQSRSADWRTPQDFYHKTVNAMDKSRGGAGAGGRGGGGAAIHSSPPIDKDADGDVDGDDERLAQEMADRLKAAEQKAKDLANAKSPNRPDRPSKVIGVGSSAGGQQKNLGSDEGTGQHGETEAEHEVEMTLDTILKKAPILIFSKSYCPYSTKAKGVLLDKYVIDPAPYVVELDQHPLGSQIQAKLAEMTGRKTVPNILISGKSIGGSDEIADLDTQKALADKIKMYAGTKISVTQRFADDAKGI